MVKMDSRKNGNSSGLEVFLKKEPNQLSYWNLKAFSSLAFQMELALHFGHPAASRIIRVIAKKSMGQS